jgi:large conductance mechanosensitive channel
MWNEFKAFINQGNVMSLAVGVIIGGAFGKIVDSVVNDLMMPIIGKVTGNVDYSNLFVPLAGQTATALADAKKLGPVLAYGSFLSILINFLILAFCVFMMVKWVASIMPKPAPAPPPGPSEKDYLKEIRDALVKGKAAGV